MLLKNLTIDRDNVLNSLRNLIISADKTKEIILNIPVIYIDGEWKIDSIKELNLYQSLFDIYDELDLWEPTEEFIPY